MAQVRSRPAWVDDAMANEAAKGRYTLAELEAALSVGLVYAVRYGDTVRLLYARLQRLDAIEDVE